MPTVRLAGRRPRATRPARSSLTPAAMRRWTWIHKGSSPVCTVFMLLLCLTGLPLATHDAVAPAARSHA